MKLIAYANHDIEMHSKIKVRVTREVDGVERHKLIDTTIGRIIFNEIIPQDLGYVDRNDPATMFDLEVNFVVGSKNVGDIISRTIERHDLSRTAQLLDDIKTLGYKYSTLAAITFSVADVVVPDTKPQLLKEADEKVDTITKQYRRGLLSDKERHDAVEKVWLSTTEQVGNDMIKCFTEENPIYIMATSGARGNIKQLRQVAGMRGLLADTSGKTVEIPIRSSFREGLDVLEYFISAHGARKGLVDTALRTADSGYLTRRLVDISQDIIVREEDCGTTEGIYVSEISDGKSVVESLKDRLYGRYTAEDVKDPVTGEIVVPVNTFLQEDEIKRINDAGIKQVKIRTLLTCKAEKGVCCKCYGNDLAARGKDVNIGEAVGIIAAQSIGEPGTQLTMQTFHQGGIAGGDITQGLPRVEELFEARKPKGLAIISDIAGTVKIEDSKRKREVIVTNNESGESKTYLIPFGSRLTVHDGDLLEAGDVITEGSIYPQDIMRIKGADGVERYIVSEVQKVYRSQGVDINDRHIEAIVRQMLRKVRVESAGDSSMLPGTLVDYNRFNRENEELEAQGLRPAEGKRLLLGITKASLATDSFLSAASFQETTRVLTEAAIKGKVDPLLGLKENVIIGKLIPAGTGLLTYRQMQPYNIETGALTKNSVPENIEITDDYEIPGVVTK